LGLLFSDSRCCSSSSSSLFFDRDERERQADKNEKSLSRFSVRVRRDDRDAPEIDRRGDVFIVPGVHRGGVFGDWDTRQHGRFVVVLSLFFRIEERLFRYFWKTTASTLSLSLSLSLSNASDTNTLSLFENENARDACENNAGWNVRGTLISNRFIQFETFVESGGCTDGACYVNPYKLNRDVLSSPPANPPMPEAPSPPPSPPPDSGDERRRRRRRRRNLSENNAEFTYPRCEELRYHGDVTYPNLDVVFMANNDEVDLFTAKAFRKICEVEENIMRQANWNEYCKGGAVPTHEEHCYLSDSSLENQAPLYYTKTMLDGSGTQMYARGCYNAISYPQVVKKGLSLNSCEELETNDVAAKVIRNLKTAVLACVDVLAADSNGICATLTATDLGIPGTEGDESSVTFEPKQYYIQAFLNGEFSSEFPNLVTTRSFLPMDWSRIGMENAMEYLVNLGKEKNVLEVSNELFYTIYGSHNDLYDYVTDLELYKDMRLASGAVIIILTLVIWNTGSLFLTTAAVSQFMLSFPVATFFLNTVLRIDFFPFLNFIGLFVICGIGADDCYVFLSKWNQAKARLPPNASAKDVSKMCYWDATYSMLLTSTTTACAFFSTAGSLIPPVRVFAIFMGSLVVFDYIFDVTIFAAAVAWEHDKKIELRKRRYEDGSKSAGWMLSIFFELPPIMRRPQCMKPDADDGDANNIDEERQEQKSPNEKNVNNTGDEKKSRTVSENVSRELVFPIIYKLRYFLVLIAIALGCASSFGGSKLSLPTDSAVELLPKEHVLTQYSRTMRSGFKSATESRIEVDVVFGLHPKDDGDHNDPTSTPSFAVDTTFDMSAPEAQLWLYNFCQKAKALAFGNESRCWMDTFALWLEDMDAAWASDFDDSQYRKTRDGTDNEWLGDFNFRYETGAWAWQQSCAKTKTLPIPHENFISCVYGWTMDSETSNGGGNYYLKNSKRMIDSLYNERYDSSGTVLVERYDSVKMLLTVVSFSLDIGWNEETSLLKKRWQTWESFIHEELKTAPAGVKNGWQTDRGAWRWFDTVENMNNNFREATLMCLGIACGIALISTANIVVTLLTIFSIGTILASTISVVVSLGWTLGFLEGICLCILIGLSVDFVIHMGHAYCAAAERGFHTRVDRTKEAFARMASPIASAAFTTFASACLLFFCTITFFQKFGTIVMISMICAFWVSLVFCVALLLVFGPEGSFGNIRDFANMCSCKPSSTTTTTTTTTTQQID